MMRERAAMRSCSISRSFVCSRASRTVKASAALCRPRETAADTVSLCSWNCRASRSSAAFTRSAKCTSSQASATSRCSAARCAARLALSTSRMRSARWLSAERLALFGNSCATPIWPMVMESRP